MEAKDAYIKAICSLISRRNQCEETILKLMDLIISDPEMVELGSAFKVTPHLTQDPSMPLPIKRSSIPVEPQVSEPAHGIRFNGMILWKAAEKLLREEGKAMGITDMVESLRRGGLDHKSKNLHTNLQYAMDGKPDRFKCTSKGVYTINNDVDHGLKLSS